jgi:hypothetical protein
MTGSTTQPTASLLPYTTPTIVELGTVREMALGSRSNDTADKKAYYN